MIDKLTIIGTPGQNDVSHPLISGTRIFGVWREGTLYNEVDPVGLPSGLQFIHVDYQIIFDLNLPFFGTLADDNRESVFILYETY